MKLIHIADIHANRERKNDVIQILKLLIKTVKELNIELVLFCGDFWDSTITNTEASGFAEIIELMKELISLTKVVMIYGTPSHEPDGSLKVFELFGAEVVSYSSSKIITLDAATLVCLPEPRLSHIKGDSLEEKIKSYHDDISSIVEDAAEAKRRNGNDLLVMYHGDIVGAELQNGMKVPKGNFALTKSILKSFNAKYIACGHIHKPQKIAENCYYSGSASPKDFGETHNAIFKIVEF